MTKTRIIKQHGLVSFPMPTLQSGFVDVPPVRPPKRKIPIKQKLFEMDFFAIATNPSLAFAQWSAITFDFTHSRPRFNRQQIDYPLTYAAVNPASSWLQWSYDHLERRPRPAARPPIIPYDGWIFAPVRPVEALPLPACVYTMDAPVTNVSTTVEC